MCFQILYNSKARSNIPIVKGHEGLANPMTNMFRRMQLTNHITLK